MVGETPLSEFGRGGYNHDITVQKESRSQLEREKHQAENRVLAWSIQSPKFHP